MAVKKTKKTVKKKAQKVAKKKTIAKAVSAKVAAKPSPALQVAGEVTHFFPHVSAAVIKLSTELKSGDMINIKGHTTDFKQTIESMQIDHVPVNEARKGAEIGVKVKDRVRIGDTVYKI
jgi:putative protease